MAADVRLTTADAGGEVWVNGDAERLQQLVANLLTNAVKFTPPGGQVHVQVGAVDSTATLRVCDTGEGISPEFMPHLFERFRQGDSTPTREHGGLGLGLSIVKDLAELHGGTVHATSDGLGKGAIFTVTLPLGAPKATSRPAIGA
jgi:signal transduction histidine kinase